jgi:glycosyltransferase involved in cell wall biosynthesis
MINKPLVSIILPTYNRAHLLPRAVDSVLAQTFPNWELIIWDDGSTDETTKVLSTYHDPRIRTRH